MPQNESAKARVGDLGVKLAGGPNRWVIAFAGTGLQVCLGTVYAWSYFQGTLAETYGWTNTQVAWVFSLAIGCLGLAAAWGGMNLARFGARRMAMAGGVLFGGGYWLAAAALHFKSLPLLYLGYGICGGIGLGLGYVTPVATAAKWFPDKKGLVTGMVIMGFGFGALLMSKVLMPTLMSVAGRDMVLVFAWLGALFMALTVFCGSLLRTPPAETLSTPAQQNSVPAADRTAWRGALFSRRFLIIWMVFFCNIVAGIAIIGFQSPLLQDLLKRTGSRLSAAELISSGATLIAISSVFNGLGRIAWGAVSDQIGRTRTFQIILGTQVAVFLALSRASNPWLFAALICYVLLCYGGGFGTMPSLVLDTFGGNLMPVVYGAVLTAWSVAGVVGPQIVAWLKDREGQGAGPVAFLVGAGFLTVGFFLSLMIGRSAKRN